MRSFRAYLFALVAIACAVVANANLEEHALEGDSLPLAALGATMNPDGTISGPGSKAGGPQPRQQQEMVHGWRAFKKIFGNPNKIEFGPDGQPLDPRERKGLRVIAKVFKSRAEKQLEAKNRKMGKRLGSSGWFGAKPKSAEKLGSGPELAKYVTARKRVFSLGLDPEVERTAAEWFESLGYVSLHGDRHFAKGYWGGVVSEMDARLAVSVCTGTSDVSVVSGYDFANWLPVPSVADALALDFPDAKFVLFETPVDTWVKHIKAKADEARALGVKCGCVSARVGGPKPTSRSTSSQCGDATHHVCDAYPCVYEKAFSTAEMDQTIWREAYVNHIAKIKTSVPTDRLLVVPLTGGHSPVTVSRALGEFIGLTATPDAFASQHPFEPHMMSLQAEHTWSFFLFLGVGIAGALVLFAPNPYAQRAATRAGYDEFGR